MQHVNPDESRPEGASELKVAEYGSGSSGILDTLHEYTSNEDMHAYDVVFLDARNFIPRLELLATGDDNLWAGVERFYDRLDAFLEAGRTLIVVPEQWQQYAHLNGHMPAASARLKALLGCRPVPKTGRDIVALGDEGFAQFARTTDGAVAYSVALEEVRGTQALASPHNNSCVGAYRWTEGGGLLLLLPAFQSDRRDMWLAAATRLATDLRNRETAADETEAVLPGWTVRYQFLDEMEALERIEHRKQQLEELVRQLEDDRDTLSGVRARKFLFSGTGDVLRAHVEDALRALGFQMTPQGAAGIEHAVATHPAHPDRKAVFAVLAASAAAEEGATLKHLFARLADYAGATGDVAKAVAIVNTWCEDDLSVRELHQEDFPARLAEIASQQRWCLMTGLQLLCMTQEAAANPARRDEIAGRLLEADGILADFRNWRSYVDERGQ